MSASSASASSANPLSALSLPLSASSLPMSASDSLISTTESFTPASKDIISIVEPCPEGIFNESTTSGPSNYSIVEPTSRVFNENIASPSPHNLERTDGLPNCQYNLQVGDQFDDWDSVDTFMY